MHANNSPCLRRRKPDRAIPIDQRLQSRDERGGLYDIVGAVSMDKWQMANCTSHSRTWWRCAPTPTPRCRGESLVVGAHTHATTGPTGPGWRGCSNQFTDRASRLPRGRDLYEAPQRKVEHSLGRGAGEETKRKTTVKTRERSRAGNDSGSSLPALGPGPCIHHCSRAKLSRHCTRPISNAVHQERSSLPN